MNVMVMPTRAEDERSLANPPPLQAGVEYRLLQPILFPASPSHLDLYMRKISGEIFFSRHLQTYGDAHLSFNTYFNSFYEAYWVGHTAVAEIDLVIKGSGFAFGAISFGKPSPRGPFRSPRASWSSWTPPGGRTVAIAVPLITTGKRLECGRPVLSIWRPPRAHSA